MFLPTDVLSSNIELFRNLSVLALDRTEQLFQRQIATARAYAVVSSEQQAKALCVLQEHVALVQGITTQVLNEGHGT